MPEPDLERAVTVFSARAVAHGMPSWALPALTGEAPLRLYRVRITALWQLDPREDKVALPLPGR